MHVKNLYLILNFRKIFSIPYFHCKNTPYYPNNQGVPALRKGGNYRYRLYASFPQRGQAIHAAWQLISNEVH
jgi:hypothetical protein